MALSDGRACKNYFSQIPIKVCAACKYEENKSNETIWGLLINTVPAYIPIDEITIVISFLCSI